MGRDTWRYAQHERERLAKKRQNPVWRGVGCVLIVVLTIAGYLFSGWFLRENALNNWVYLPPEILTLSFAPWLPYGVAVQLVVAFLFMIFGYGVLSFFYAIAFPIRPGETDAPPLRRSAQKKR
jgi:polyferredoxin